MARRRGTTIDFASLRVAIGIAFNQIFSTTDNYPVFDDFGERLTGVKLKYHAQETVGIRTE